MATIICANCKATHESVHAVRACHDGATIDRCTWLVERVHSYVDEETGEWWGGEDGPSIEDCGAEAIYTDRGFECAAGHSHVHAEIRWQEGWEYAADRGEAESLSKYGTEPRDLVTGGAFRW